MPAAFPAGSGSDGHGPLARAGDCDVAEQALRAVATEHLRHRIREVLAALPDDQRLVVRLRLFEGWDDAQAAEALGVTSGQAAALWRDGFATLWAALSADPALGIGDGSPAADAPAQAVAQLDP
jgi:DNA-directed RNA polymerase specialized sigma24 family protein